MKHCLALLLLPFASMADVTVSISNCGAFNWECDFQISGDPGPVTVTLTGGALLDWFGQGSAGPFLDTVPSLGTQNNSIRLASATIDGPVSTRVDIDSGSMSGGTITVNGVTEPFVQSGSTWNATVVTLPTGAAELSWTVPTENTDNTPLTDLAGFKLYWGTAPGSYPNSVQLDNPGLMSYVIENLPYAHYYFVATAFNSMGRESAQSNVAEGIVSAEPGAPSDVIVIESASGPLVTTDVRVYGGSRLPDANGIFRVGDVALGVECVGTEGYLAGGEVFYVVTKANVVYPLGQPQPDVNYVRCAAPSP